MQKSKLLIISLLPLKPVKSGYQNSVFLLFEFLKKKFDIKFFNLNNENDIDPVLNLNIRSDLNKIENIIKNFKPKNIIVNTTKLLFLLQKVLLKNNIKPILLIHDLYFFRKKYFKSLGLVDNIPLSKVEELKLINSTKITIDFSIKEKSFLLNNGVDSRRLIYTHTAIKSFKKKINLKKNNAILFVGSQWKQNFNNIKTFFNKNYTYFQDKKFLIIGPKLIGAKKNVSFVNYSRNHFYKSRIGIAPIKPHNGRNVKIFEMMSAGLPVFTNLDLSDYGLKNLKHYCKVPNQNWRLFINKYYDDLKFLNKIADNAKRWTLKRNNFKYAYGKILKYLD